MYVGRFEKLNRKVEELRAQKDSRSRQHDTHQEKVDQLRNEWLQSVKHFIERLDRNFSRFMSKMMLFIVDLKKASELIVVIHIKIKLWINFMKTDAFYKRMFYGFLAGFSHFVM